MDRKFLLSALCALTLGTAFSQDFSQNGINFQILDSSAKTVTTAKPAQTGTSANPDAKGNVVIPSKVMYGGVEYTVTQVADYSFFSNSGITSLTLPQTLTYIGMNSFNSCTGLTSLTIPDNVQTIDTRAFAGCSGLEELTLGTGLTKVGMWAFYDCTSLKTVTCNAITPPGSTAQTFSQTTYDTATLYVPDNSVSAYKGDTKTWGKFYQVVSSDGPFNCSIYMQPEETFDISIYYAEYSADTYTSANQSVATVTNAGKVTAVSYGTTTIDVKGAGTDLGTVTVYVGPSVTVENGSGVIYAHPVAYNSVPKLYIGAGGGYKLAGVTYNGLSIGDELISNSGYYTPTEPINANAVINVTLAEDPSTDATTGAADIFTSSGVRIYVDGHNIQFVNTPANARITMTNVAGTVLFDDVATSINVIDSGVYIITIDGVNSTFKALIR